MKSLNGVGHRNAFSVELQLSAHLLACPNIKFCHVNVLHEGCIKGQSFLKFLYTWPEDVVMTLHSDTIDGDARRTHLQHHIVDVAALARVTLVIIVIEQNGFRVGFACKMECFGNEFVATKLIEFGLAIGVRTSVRHRLVHNIPSINNIFVAIHDRLDVFLEASIKGLFIDEIAHFIVKHPVRELIMPDETMASHLDAVLPTEVSDAIRLFPSPNIG